MCGGICLCLTTITAWLSDVPREVGARWGGGDFSRVGWMECPLHGDISPPCPSRPSSWPPPVDTHSQLIPSFISLSSISISSISLVTQLSERQSHTPFLFLLFFWVQFARRPCSLLFPLVFFFLGNLSIGPSLCSALQLPSVPLLLERLASISGIGPTLKIHPLPSRSRRQKVS
jgi:hypothetical protein